ncbi:MAG: kinase/pyrophosphorylase [Epsilonproteobacteria bacterium]|nr:kinase/pyrophosphorylase [Campylobacterota bacterium]
MNKKRLLLVSDGTAETVKKITEAFLVQFDDPNVTVTRFGRVKNTERLSEVIEAVSAQPDVMVLFTIANTKLRNILHRYCEDNNISHIDIFGFFLRKFEEFLEKKISGRSGLLHKIGDRYFDRIAALDYTLAHDDNKSVKDIELADIVILGLSRSGKTPLSLYLAEDGYRVANFALVKGESYPSILNKIDNNRIVILTIEPENLLGIRRHRARKLHLNNSNYCSRSFIYEETEMIYELVKKHPEWLKADVTGRSIEEIASEILEVINKKNGIKMHNL